MNRPSIQFKHVSKQYRIGRGLPSVKTWLGIKRRQDAQTYHWAVKDVNFAVQPGEALGIIGPNGAGKTTILKLLSRVTSPTSGQAEVNGRMSALIELGAGFHPELTGRENIYLNGVILGMSKREITARLEQIVEFAGVGKFIDTPVKRYSSGMYARLGFAIAAHVEPEALLVDEVLAVGDHPFQMKCYARMSEMRAAGTAMILVSHNMDAVRRVCDRGLVMYRGAAIFEGSAQDAVIAYSDAVRTAARGQRQVAPVENGLSERVMTFDAEIVRVRLQNEFGEEVATLRSGAYACVLVDVSFHTPVAEPVFALTVRTPDGRLVYDTTTRWANLPTPRFAAGDTCRVEYRLELPLLDGCYEVGVDVATADLSHYYDRIERALQFWIEGSRRAQGVVDLNSTVLVHPSAPTELA